MSGYHINYINKGVWGYFSKIEEEFNKFKDAHDQGCSVMELMELSDLISATIAFYRKNGKDSRWVNVHDVLMKERSSTVVTYEVLIEKFNSIRKNKPEFTDIANFILAIHHYVKKFNLVYGDLYCMHIIKEKAFLKGHKTKLLSKNE